MRAYACEQEDTLGIPHRWRLGGNLGKDVGDFPPAEAEANYYAAIKNLDMVA